MVDQIEARYAGSRVAETAPIATVQADARECRNRTVAPALRRCQ